MEFEKKVRDDPLIGYLYYYDLLELDRIVCFKEACKALDFAKECASRGDNESMESLIEQAYWIAGKAKKTDFYEIFAIEKEVTVALFNHFKELTEISSFLGDITAMTVYSQYAQNISGKYSLDKKRDLDGIESEGYMNAIIPKLKMTKQGMVLENNPFINPKMYLEAMVEKMDLR